MSCRLTCWSGSAAQHFSRAHSAQYRSTYTVLCTFCAAAQLKCSFVQGITDKMPSVCRDVVAPTLQIVADAAEALRSKGFVNYFGLQRFGAGVNATHQ